ncbi:hypothetical protein DFR50_13113 [Roseiarcus fermentans]|uniref:Uncharacterized protein n=1 Tax=Roseiarcus fermentans TaxID=1473586 RepID=A0A366EVH2_9HYPH|nr:hypothetical protein [Roseiarcus fermentans]RBP06393.1 hypothetical protein DFR50_13113 [Roseiarcus fermentans]
MRKPRRRTVLGWIASAIALLWPWPVLAEALLVGVNVVNPMRASVADQNAILAEIKAARVAVIRCGISNDDKGVDFAKRALAQGIRLQLIVTPEYGPSAPKRPYQPDAFPHMWGGPPLSAADPALSKAAFQRLFDALDAAGIPIAGAELGNEINWAGFNPEFPLPGEGRIFSLEDLAGDPEAAQVARGFLKYLDVLAALKDVRDRSRLNHAAPIISAGLVSAEDGAKIYNSKKEDMVSLSATLAFLRAHGLDRLVDAYGVHAYPSTARPGDPAATAALKQRLQRVDLAACRPRGAGAGKPCWITEWGFPNADLACPSAREAGRTLLVEETRAAFSEAAAEGRLMGIDYFSWNSDPWSKEPDADSVFRCGALTQSGRAAMAPEVREAKAASAEPGRAGPDGSMRVRVGPPLVVRGPAPDIADDSFTEIELPNGLFRGFTAAGTTIAIDGKTPHDMGGKARTVLGRGPPGAPDSCGQWLQHVERQGKTLIGWVHNETACDYAKGGQTHASMTIATSADDGLTWTVEGPIIRGTDPPAAGKETGDSCVTAIRGDDGYDYAYCKHNGGHPWEGGYGFIARAPASDPGPGKWTKYFDGAWSEPGVDGRSGKLDGGGVAWWRTTSQTLGLNWVKGGLGLEASKDRLHFAPVFAEPLMLAEPGDWSRKNGLELVAYPVLLDAKSGSNQLGDRWLLTYMYLSPGETFARRYLVFRPVDIAWTRGPGEPEVGEMLTHWYAAARHDHWATTAPVPENNSAYKLVAELGYVMTSPDAAHASVELEECVSDGPGHPDHILIENGVCESHGYRRLRSAGFVYSAQQTNTQPLYRCYSDSEKSHFAANRDDCDGMGKREALLGYDLER